MPLSSWASLSFYLQPAARIIPPRTISAEILKTVDGGVNWQRSYKSASIAVNCLYFLDEHHGWAGCSDGPILKYHH